MSLPTGKEGNKWPVQTLANIVRNTLASNTERLSMSQSGTYTSTCKPKCIRLCKADYVKGDAKYKGGVVRKSHNFLTQLDHGERPQL